MDNIVYEVRRSTYDVSYVVQVPEGHEARYPSAVLKDGQVFFLDVADDTGEVLDTVGWLPGQADSISNGEWCTVFGGDV